MWLFLQTKKRLDEGVNRFFILRGLHVFEVHEDGVVLIVVTADAVGMPKVTALRRKMTESRCGSRPFLEVEMM